MRPLPADNRTVWTKPATDGAPKTITLLVAVPAEHVAPLRRVEVESKLKGRDEAGNLKRRRQSSVRLDKVQLSVNGVISNGYL
jgi:hypothetical protein